jgi:hypothetical protein
MIQPRPLSSIAMALSAFLIASYGIIARAQPPATAPIRTGPFIRGLDLSSVPFTDSAENNDDLHEHDPDRPHARRLRADVFTLEIDRGWSVMYAPRRQQFYIRYQAPGIVLRGPFHQFGPVRIFGPLLGDPFPVLKLDEMLQGVVTASSDQNHEMDRAVRAMQSLIANGDGPLAMHGLTLMKAVLQKEETLIRKAPAILLSRKLIDEHGARIRQQGVIATMADADATLTAMEARLEHISVELPRDRYAAASEVKPAPPTTFLAENWGDAVDGLRAAAVPERTVVATGQAATIYLIIQNVSDHDIRISTLRDLEQSASARLTGPDGTYPLQRQSLFISTVPIVRFWLKPAEMIVVAEPRVVFESRWDSADNPASAHGTKFAHGPSGRYRIDYSFAFRPEIVWEQTADGTWLRIKSEWRGTLNTGLAALDLLPTESATTQPMGAR